MKLSNLLLVFLSSGALLTGCSKDKDSGKKPAPQAQSAWQMFFATSAETLRVVDSLGQPIAGAQVLIGNSLNQPFAENFITTGSGGSFVAPQAWQTPEMITIAATGFVRATYLAQLPLGQNFELRMVPAMERLELSGQGTGFQTKDKDNRIDFALMIPALSRTDLFSFNLGMMISPEVDTITLMGQNLDVPSNVVLPRQKESYILPITIEKSKYRMYFSSKGTKRVYTARGQFPFKEVVKELQANKPFQDLINYFTLQGGSLKTANITGAKQSMDLPVNELVFNQIRSFKSPAFGADEFLLALPLSEYNSELFPTDVKNVEPGKMVNLTTAAGSTPQLLTVLKRKKENALGAGRLSVAILPFTKSAQPIMLPLMENPQVVGINEVKFPQVAPMTDIAPVATLSVLSRLVVKTVNNLQIEELTPLWEVYAPNWASGFLLPEWPGDQPVAGTKRWDVSFVGSLNAKTIDLGPRMLETATHATHSSSDF